MKPDAIIVRAGRLKARMFVAPLARLGAGFAQLADAPTPVEGGSHVCLRYVDQSFFSVHAGQLYVALVDCEAS